MRLIIKNGKWIDRELDFLIEDGIVREMAKGILKVSGAEIIDAKGCIVSPGFVDLHTHLREPGYEYKETIQTGTQSAAAGGFTSICCMANTNPVNDKASVTSSILEIAREKGVVNVFPIGAVTKGLEGKELAEIGELHKAGCVAISDDGKCVDNARLQRVAMEYAKNFDMPIIVHAIDPALAGAGVMNESFVSTKLGLPGIPNEAEDIMIARDIALAELTGASLHIAHLSTAGGIDLVRRAKKKGLKVTCEVTPHHLVLTDERVIGYDTNTKMCPPLRGEADRQALIAGIADGTVDAIATDHAPHSQVDKEVEFDRAAFGIVGLETALPLVLSLVDGKKITLKRIIEMLTVNPARIVSLRKGSLKVGEEADITIFDPKLSYTVDPGAFSCKSKNTPFGGMKVKGKIKYTIVKGKIVYGG